MKNWKKILAALMILAVCFGLSGCTSSLGIESLLAPPALQGQQKEIYTALNKSVLGEIRLIYPLKGEYRSSIITLNLDNEEGEEAIAFYQMASTSQPLAMPLRVNVLDKRGDQWVSVYELGVDADDVEKVSLLHSGGETYLVVGYNFNGSNSKEIQIYHYHDQVLELIQRISAVNYEICDINEDHNDEIVALVAVPNYNPEEDLTQTHIEAGVIQVQDGVFIPVNTVQMNPNVTDYASISISRLYDGKPAIYLDGIIGTQLSSEILFCDAYGRLNNLIYQPDYTEADQSGGTQRQLGIYSMDINNDDIIEVPRTTIVPGYEEKERYEQVFFTWWSNYSENGSKRSFESYTDLSLGYVLRMPHNWEDRVTVEVNSADNEVIFYEYNNITAERGLPILSIRVMSSSDYAAQDLSGKYSLLSANGQLVFLYHSHNDISEYALSEEIIRDSLYVLN